MGWLVRAGYNHGGLVRVRLDANLTNIFLLMQKGTTQKKEQHKNDGRKKADVRKTPDGQNKVEKQSVL